MRKFLDGGVIVEVTLLRDLRHHQVIADEEHDQIDFLVVESEALRHFRRQARAALMMVVAVALADIVEQQREEDERQMRQLARDLGEQRGGVLELARAQAFELAHRNQRMPVDGVDMVEVVQNAGVEVAKLRDDRAEHARQMHRLERVGDALARRENRHQRGGDARVPAHAVVDQAEIVAHQLVGAARQAHVLRLAVGVNRDQVERILLKEIGLRDAQQIALNDHARTNLAARRAAKKSPAGAVLGHARDQALGEAMDRRRMLVVRAHQRGAGGLSFLGLEAEQRFNPFLHLESELIKMASRQEVQRITHAPEKIARLDHLRRFRLGDDSLLYQLFERMDLVLDLGQPHRRVQIAQAAFAFLDLRLEQVDRIAVLGVAFAAFLELGGEKLVLVAIEDVGDEQLVELGVELFVAAQEARVEDRGFLLQVIVGEPYAFLGRAHAVPDDQTRVPQRVQNYFGDNFSVRTALVVVQEEQVDVGLRIELAAAVAAARDHRDFLVKLGRTARVFRVGVPIQSAQQIVHRSRHRGHDFAAAGTGKMTLGQLGAD